MAGEKIQGLRNAVQTLLPTSYVLSADIAKFETNHFQESHMLYVSGFSREFMRKGGGGDKLVKIGIYTQNFLRNII